MVQRDESGHDHIREEFDEFEPSIFDEGMARMALYHRYCQDCQDPAKCWGDRDGPTTDPRDARIELPVRHHDRQPRIRSCQARSAGFQTQVRILFLGSTVSAEGVAEHGVDFFSNYLANPQSTLPELTRA